MIDKKERILFIVESPVKVKSIQPILKELGYTNVVVMASKGHITQIKDTGEYNLGIDTNNFEIKFEVSPDKKEIVSKLKEQVKLASKVILASDPDREGEAISWALKETLKIPDSKYIRITYHEITKSAIEKALNESRKIDKQLVEAAHTRSRLDKIVGYRLSSVARNNINARSVGRCQSAGLKLVVDRENEIVNFKPEEYFEICLDFKKNKTDFKAKYVDKKGNSKIDNKAKCDGIIADCNKGDYSIKNIESKQAIQNSPLPFTTSTFQQEASSKLGIGINESSNIAQKLFEGVDVGGKHIALITYIRTDDTSLAPEFVDSAKEYIEDIYGKKYYSGVKESKKKENVQAGHEAIRPVDLGMTPDKLRTYISDDRMLKIYNLIYNRTLASLMSARKFNNTIYTIVNGNHNFVMQSKEETFDGWRRLYNYTEEKDEEVIKETFKEGEILKDTFLDLLTKQTTPPSRYTESTFLKTLDKLGIGRPSTYKTIENTLLDEKRNYCKVEDKKFVPTSLGIDLIKFLDKNFGDIVDSGYSANMEKDLDLIADGKLKDIDFLKNFYAKLEEDINKVDKSSVERICPECGGKLVMRFNKKNKTRFLGCSNYPNCHHIENL